MPAPTHAELRLDTVTKINSLGKRAQRIFEGLSTEEAPAAYHLLQQCIRGLASRTDIFPEHPDQLDL